jgi:hypothetical protein
MKLNVTAGAISRDCLFVIVTLTLCQRIDGEGQLRRLALLDHFLTSFCPLCNPQLLHQMRNIYPVS